MLRAKIGDFRRQGRGICTHESGASRGHTVAEKAAGGSCPHSHPHRGESTSLQGHNIFVDGFFCGRVSLFVLGDVNPDSAKTHPHHQICNLFS